MAESKATAFNQRAARRTRSGPTIADVARQAGVSPMTVSRVLNAGPRVTEETREKVNRTIAALGYVPNPAARSLAGGRSSRIALLYANPSAAFLSEFLVGCLAEATLRDVELTVEPYTETEFPETLAARLVSRRIDAALLPPPLCEDAELVLALNSAGIAVALIATSRPQPHAEAICIDDEAAAHAMTARLIALGHRRIGFVSGNPNQSASALRQAGFERALVEAGLAADPGLIVEGDFTYRSGLVAGERLLDREFRPTAIFASNDDMAAAVIATAHRLRLDVPAALSVCGFDDTAIATTISPELTTIRQPIAEMARLGMLVLSERARLDTAEDSPLAGRRELGFSLIIRGSDGPPPSG